MMRPQEIEEKARELAKIEGRQMTDADLLFTYMRIRLMEAHEQTSETMGMWARLSLASPEQLRKMADEKEAQLKK